MNKKEAKRYNKIEKQQRKTVLLKMLGQGANYKEISERLNISIPTYWRMLKQLRTEIESKDKSDEALLKIISTREQIYRDAQTQYHDSKKPSDKINALRVLNQTTDGMEKTYARIGLVPIEKQGVELSGADKVIEQLKKWKDKE